MGYETSKKQVVSNLARFFYKCSSVKFINQEVINDLILNKI